MPAITIQWPPTNAADCKVLVDKLAAFDLWLYPLPQYLLGKNAVAMLGPMVRAAHAAGKKVRWATNPTAWNYRWPNAPADWQTKDGNGNPTGGLCIARPEARQLIVDQLACWACPKLGMDGIVLDEVEQVCCCDYCKPHHNNVPEQRNLWARYVCAELMLAARDAIKPVPLAASGCEIQGHIDIGLDWPEWSTRGWIGWMGPSIADDAAHFAGRLDTMLATKPVVPVVPIVFNTISEMNGQHFPIADIKANVALCKSKGLDWIAYTYDGYDAATGGGKVVMTEEELVAFAGTP